MDSLPLKNKPSPVPEFLSGGGEMGQRIREYDWSKTSLGPVESWPQSLRTCIRIMLTSRQPIWIGWGKELIKLYNDPYKAIVGGKHPRALGKPASLVWKDIWSAIDPMLRQVMEMDEGTYVESQLLIMERNGYPEETYYTFSYTPIPGDSGGTAGMICANTDDTDRIISERQLQTLTRLGKSLTDSKSEEKVIQRTIAALAENPHDFPFALFYTISDDKAILTCSTELGDAADNVPSGIPLQGEDDFAGLLKIAGSSKRPAVLENLKEKLGEMPRGAWPIPPVNAIILPIIQNSSKGAYGFLIIGLNPYRLLDDKYSGFFSLLADQVSTSFSNVYLLEEERKRAEALAEIDRAKTTFFSNISHEFRTPLTLLLGPIEDVLNDPGNAVNNKTRMDVAYRNALRLQKLVNNLLEFSRIETGRVEGRFTRVDIASFTQDLASSFRSAVEKAGLSLNFNFREIKDEVYVDIEMWEKIILNLVSNAFKYTREGRITISVEQVRDEVRIAVSDTGIGIPADQLEKVFDRFHRVENISVRSQEGTGIGLALVRELVKIHRGTIRVVSEPGMGSTFTVSVPVGRDHLPADKITGADQPVTGYSNRSSFVQEALKWIPEENLPHEKAGWESRSENPGQSMLQAGRRFRVLLADDNADMRDYVGRVLTEQFDLATAHDGEDAYEKLLALKPDLLLTDIMMPRLDGFGLLKKIRKNPETRYLPVIFLSARAGEEAKVEGLEAGADDYLVKPFSAKELIARVDAAIRINAARRDQAKLLEQEVRNRTVELNDLNYSLQQSNDDLQQFAHVASHDLKEPVRKVKMFAGRLHDDAETRFSEKGRVYLSKIDSAADRMLSMIEGVLNYSLINSVEQHMERIDLNKIIKNIESDLELLIGQKMATITCTDLPAIEGAAVLIYQLFYNLINNSLKFAKADIPAVISVSATLAKEGNRDFAVIRIADNGIGFVQDQAQRIFDTFSRLNSREKYEGTGLGLSLCKKIVQRHGGRIGAVGEKGQGAVFILHLPVKQE